MRALLFVVFMLVGQALYADPIAPSLLEIDDRGSARFDVTWRTPIKPVLSNALPLTLVFTDPCQVNRMGNRVLIGNLLEEQLQVTCLTAEQFGVEVDALYSPSANVLLRFYRDGKQAFTHILSPGNSDFSYQDSVQEKHTLAYFVFGIEHLLIGFDHVLYLLCLIILAGISRALIVIISLFTLAHSITLASAALDIVRLPVQWVEIAIALSIVYSAIMVINKNKDNTPKRLGLSVIVFGLLHGFGFSNVLAELGLPSEEVVIALVLFNLGIEAGQLIIIGLVTLLVVAFIRKIQHFKQHQDKYVQLMGWIIGLMASYWFWQRLLGG